MAAEFRCVYRGGASVGDESEVFNTFQPLGSSDRVIMWHEWEALPRQIIYCEYTIWYVHVFG